MAEQLTIPELNGGVPLDDPTDSQLYVVKDGADYPLNFNDMFKFIYRSNPSESCNGSEGQVITYSTPFINLKPHIFDFLGIGIEVTAWDENGFTITSYGSGTFGYLTMKSQ